MQALARAICRAGNGGSSSKITHLRSSAVNPVIANARLSATAPFSTNSNINEQLPLENRTVNRMFLSVPQTMIRSFLRNTESNRYMATEAQRVEDSEGENVLPVAEPAPRIKFKRLDKTAKHIMSILDTEEVEKVRTEKEILDIRPGCIVELKVEVPENKRRVSTVKGIVIARRNAGLNTTFRLRRLVAGVGVESVYPLYSPNIKAMKIIDRKKVRRAKLYYLRDRMNALKK